MHSAPKSSYDPTSTSQPSSKKAKIVSSSSYGHSNQSVDETVAALEAHLVSLKSALPKVRGFKESKEVCEAIAACANAIAAVKAIGN
jgi:hypothetical protein